MHWLYSTLNTIAKALIRFCIVGLRPLLGPATCRYPQGCTSYALEMLNTRPLGEAIWLTIKRVLACNPF